MEKRQKLDSLERNTRLEMMGWGHPLRQNRGPHASCFSCSKLLRDGYDTSPLHSDNHSPHPSVSLTPLAACGVESNGNNFVPEAAPASLLGTLETTLGSMAHLTRLPGSTGALSRDLPLFFLNSLQASFLNSIPHPLHRPQSPSVMPHRYTTLRSIPNTSPFDLSLNGCS